MKARAGQSKQAKATQARKTHIYRHNRAAREARGAIIFFLMVPVIPRIDPATRLAPGRPPEKFHFFGRPARGGKKIRWAATIGGGGRVCMVWS